MPSSATVAMPAGRRRTVGAASPWLIVPVACEASGSSVSGCPLLVAPVSVTRTVSSASKTSSVVGLIVIVPVVAPAAMRIEPVMAA